jgi:hypothetical protein
MSEAISTAWMASLLESRDRTRMTLPTPNENMLKQAKDTDAPYRVEMSQA